MEPRVLGKQDLNKEIFENIKFFKISEGGAMGTPGEVLFVNSYGESYVMNYCYDDITIQDVFKYFPVLSKCEFGLFGKNSIVPDEWNYVNLGMGNHLLVAVDVYEQFKKDTQYIKSMGEMFGKWYEIAIKLINEKEKEKMEKNTNVKNGNGITELVFILDRSGSMSGLEKDTIGGFNSMIEKQKKEAGECYVSTVLFDNESQVVHDRVKLSEIKPMTEDDYYVRGCTALIDAIGGAIHHIGNIHKYARSEDVPEHTMFIITTDGMENASHRYTSERVKHMIERQKIKFGWEFLFIGANIDAVETAAQYGIDEDRAVNYNADSKGTEILYSTVSQNICRVRANAPIEADWSEEINKDYEKRGKKH